MTKRRRGFALLAALWITVGLSATALAGLLLVRGAIAGAQNRIALTRGRWRAEECLERARAVIADALVGGQAMPRPVPGGWDALDRVVAASPAIADVGCDVRLVPTAIAIDVNSVGAEQLQALFRAIGIPEPRADSMVDALFDWRDADDIPRPLGAEAEWYHAAGRFTPRNGPLVSVQELRRVRGFDPVTLSDSMLNTLFTVEPGPLLWTRAPLTVLASVPGVGDEALARLAELRAQGASVINVTELGASLTPPAQEVFLSRYSDMERLTTNQCGAWLLTARGGGVTIELRLTRVGTRAAIVRRRITQ